MSTLQKQIPNWLLWLFAILIIIATPLVHSYETVDITLVPQFYIFSLSLLLLIILLLIFGKQKNYSFFVGPFHFGLIFYLLFSITSLIGSKNPSEGFFDLFKIGIWILLIVLSIHLLMIATQLKSILCKAFTISSFILSLIGILQITGFAFTKIPSQLSLAGYWFVSTYTV